MYVFDDVLLLRAAREYPRGVGERGPGTADEPPDFGEDPLAHITNTARQAEDDSFREDDKLVGHFLFDLGPWREWKACMGRGGGAGGLGGVAPVCPRSPLRLCEREQTGVR